MSIRICLGVLTLSLATLSGCATVADEQQAVPEDQTRPRGQAEALGSRFFSTDKDTIAFHLSTPFLKIGARG
ncbi:MAG: hypothetical protein NVSMB14_00090 [Isosphaeraceae bacterium]